MGVPVNVRIEERDLSTRVSHHRGIVGFIMPSWAERFTFRQEPSKHTQGHPFCLRACVPGTNEHAVVSFRRARTLILWSRDHFGEDRVTITRDDLFGFVTEADMIMFATFWNGVEVPMCSPEDAS